MKGALLVVAAILLALIAMDTMGNGLCQLVDPCSWLGLAAGCTCPTGSGGGGSGAS